MLILPDIDLRLSGLRSTELAEAQRAASAAREQAAAMAERYRAQAEDWAHARQQLQTANAEVRSQCRADSSDRGPYL